MKQVINIHADDFGIGDEITDTILESITNGAVNSISIVCNTDHFMYGIDRYNAISEKVRLCLHLNLVEGKPIGSNKETSLIINEAGEFKFSFLALWSHYIASSNSKKEALRHQITTEIEHQILRYKNAIHNNTPIRVDSHMHFHMIPFVFECLLEVSKKHQIDFIRNPYEVRYRYGFTKIENHLALNFVKNTLLNSLSKKYIKKARKLGIKTNDYFIGVLSTGRMSYQDVYFALAKIKNKKTPESIDILFHPGRVTDKNNIDWTEKNAFLSYYSSKDRAEESKVLQKSEFQSLIQDYENIFNN